MYVLYLVLIIYTVFSRRLFFSKLIMFCEEMRCHLQFGRNRTHPNNLDGIEHIEVKIIY